VAGAGLVWDGEARLGQARQEWRVPAGLGTARTGLARKGRQTF
jgi:hypothetical protein